ncbi:MAG TPA: glycosyltransferase [Duganella sp.]|nr:glycosyltransferase [Duganella sp.]
MVKRVLMIAYHYPPLLGGSGMQRTLAFTRYLPREGWEPIVLSVTPNAYPARESSADTPAHRSYALDTARHLALRGRYPALLAQPDRWISWWFSAVPAGLRLIRRYRPQVIWSSYPIATAHLVGLTLHRLSGLPWIADQRDPMLDHDYPPDLRRHRIHRWIEQQAMQRGAAVVCTTPGAVSALRARHACGRVELIGNGYDEASFIAAEIVAAPARLPGGPFRLLHSGVIYPSERDPRALFSALRQLRSGGVLRAGNFRLVLRATGHDDYLRTLLDGLEDIVELAPPLPYREGLAEMMAADGLLLLQAANCNHQIPAKMYEYLRAHRPLLALTHPDGDTAWALRRAGIDTIARLDQAADIAAALIEFLHLCRTRQAPLAVPDATAAHSRAARTRELALLLDQVHRKESA